MLFQSSWLHKVQIVHNAQVKSATRNRPIKKKPLVGKNCSARVPAWFQYFQGGKCWTPFGGGDPGFLALLIASPGMNAVSKLAQLHFLGVSALDVLLRLCCIKTACRTTATSLDSCFQGIRVSLGHELWIGLSAQPRDTQRDSNPSYQ